ncbi:MAG TPA: HEAT repeat domain-containing protein, partial [Lacipirellulaceae bacterium]
DPKEQSVRLGAIEAIAVRAFNLSHLQPPQPLANPDLEPALFRLASDDDPLVRSETAYALGQVGAPECLDRLEAMLDDAYPDARENAAVALAHHGRAKAVATLAEMLNPAESADGGQDDAAGARAANLALTMTSALAAAEDLARQNPDADLSPVIQAIKNLVGAKESPAGDKTKPASATIDPQIVAAAHHTLEVLEK